MAHYAGLLNSDAALASGLVRESAHLYKDELEQGKTEKELIELLRGYRLGDIERIKEYVLKFIREVNSILTELERERRIGLKNEFQKLEGLLDLLSSQKKFKLAVVERRTIKIEKKIIARMKIRVKELVIQTARAKKGMEPKGYYLIKAKGTRSLSSDIRKAAARMTVSAEEEGSLLGDVKRLIQEFEASPMSAKLFRGKSILKRLEEKIAGLLSDYEEDLEYVYRTEIEIDVEEIRKLHQIDLVINYIKRVGEKRLLGFIESLEKIKQQAEYWVVQDYREEEKQLGFIQQCEDVLRQISLPHALDYSGKKNLESFQAFINRPLKPEDMILVHMTNYFPRKGILRSRLSGRLSDPQESNLNIFRDSLHFTINGPVSAVSAGIKSWEDCKFAALVPMTQFPVNRIENFSMNNTTILGNLAIPTGSVVLGRRRDILAEANNEGVSLKELVDFFQKKYIRLLVLKDSDSTFRQCKEVIARSGRHLQSIAQWSNQCSLDAESPAYRAGQRSEEFAKSIGAVAVHQIYTEHFQVESLQRFYTLDLAEFRKWRRRWPKEETCYDFLFLSFTGLQGTVFWLNRHVDERKYFRSNSLLLSQLYNFLVFMLKELEYLYAYLYEWWGTGKQPAQEEKLNELFIWLSHWRGRVFNDHYRSSGQEEQSILHHPVMETYTLVLKNKMDFSNDVRRRYPGQIKAIADVSGKIIEAVAKINAIHAKLNRDSKFLKRFNP